MKVRKVFVCEASSNFGDASKDIVVFVICCQKKRTVFSYPPSSTMKSANDHKIQSVSEFAPVLSLEFYPRKFSCTISVVACKVFYHQTFAPIPYCLLHELFDLLFVAGSYH